MWLDRLRMVEVSYCDLQADGSRPLPSGGYSDGANYSHFV